MDPAGLFWVELYKWKSRCAFFLWWLSHALWLILLAGPTTSQLPPLYLLQWKNERNTDTMKNTARERNAVNQCLWLDLPRRDHEEGERRMLVWERVCVVVWQRHKDPVCAALDCPSRWTQGTFRIEVDHKPCFFRPTGWRPRTSPPLSSILCDPPALHTARPHRATAATPHSTRILFIKASQTL